MIVFDEPRPAMAWGRLARQNIEAMGFSLVKIFPHRTVASDPPDKCVECLWTAWVKIDGRFHRGTFRGQLSDLWTVKAILDLFETNDPKWEITNEYDLV